MMERLHPETIRELRNMVRLHGTVRIIAAVREIEAAEKSCKQKKS
jgi:hypothetical protein